MGELKDVKTTHVGGAGSSKVIRSVVSIDEIEESANKHHLERYLTCLRSNTHKRLAECSSFDRAKA